MGYLLICATVNDDGDDVARAPARRGPHVPAETDRSSWSRSTWRDYWWSDEGWWAHSRSDRRSAGRLETKRLSTGTP